MDLDRLGRGHANHRPVTSAVTENGQRDDGRRDTSVLFLLGNGRTIVGEGELARDGMTWEGDLALTYTRMT